MFCPRCEKLVRQCLEEAGCSVIAVKLGKAIIKACSKKTLSKLSYELKHIGFELLVKRNEQQAEQIKNQLIYAIYYQHYTLKLSTLQDYFEQKTNQKYQYLDNQFKSSFGVSIINYFKSLRFERAKELISYQEQSAKEIARCLGYTSLKQLNSDFKQRLNLTVTEFFTSENKHRLPLNKLI